MLERLMRELKRRTRIVGAMLLEIYETWQQELLDPASSCQMGNTGRNQNGSWDGTGLT
jgi:hypothetical protein